MNPKLLNAFCQATAAYLAKQPVDGHISWHSFMLVEDLKNLVEPTENGQEPISGAGVGLRDHHSKAPGVK